MAAPKQVRHERYEDAKGERTDYNPGYGRGADAGAVCLIRGTRWHNNSVVRALSYCLSV